MRDNKIYIQQDFNVTEGKYVRQQRVAVIPIVNCCKNIKHATYSCPICSKIATSHESLYDNIEHFCNPSFPHGIKNCPRCGINLKW